MGTPPEHLSPEARQELLTLARTTLQGYFSTGKTPEYTPVDDGLRVHSGAFVSLHRGEELRGCIGQIVAEIEVYRVVQHCALSAALEDMRFTPVVESELPELEIEISVLTPMRRIGDVSEVEVGRHGLYISRGMHRGLLLPQVATEYAWDRETFLAQTCRKAGLHSSAWREPGTVIQIFEAQVFSEK
jgi:AmmeMemoRadiSam system protein A